MRNKGLVLFFAILVALTCLYCLSFSIVSTHVENKAEKYANDPAAIAEVVKQANGNVMIENSLTDSLKNARYNYFISKMADSVIFLGNTFTECKYKEVNLGLDLKGGMNVTLEVSIPDVVYNLASNKDDTLFVSTYKKALAEYSNDNAEFIDIFISVFNEQKKALNLNNAKLTTYFIESSGLKNPSENDIINFIKRKTEDLVENTFTTLRTRIDRFGVAQPNIQRLQKGRILIELPGIKEPERVKELLKTTAKLEFWEVYSEPINGLSIQESFRRADITLSEKIKMREQTQQIKKSDSTTNTDLAIVDSTSTKEDLEEEEETYEGLGVIFNKIDRSSMTNPITIGNFKIIDTTEINKYLPEIKKLIGDPNLELFWGKTDAKTKGLVALIPVKKNNKRFGPKLCAEMLPQGSAMIKDARQDINNHNEPVVSMAMGKEATNLWRDITREAASKKNVCIAIVLDNFVYSAPTVRSEIPNGNSEISGSFTIEEAKDLATVLNSGNLDAPVNIVQSEIVGPSLGEESINSGLISFVLAFILVLVYMRLYYSKAGFVANTALFLNIFFIFGVLASVGAVLTLPGIAGIVLTIGMAVDANVIIFERIREEVRIGKGVRLAIQDGYKNAYSAIIDGNITTLITGVVLFIFGSGPVQGFATTLIIGILSSLFTAIFITRIVFEKMMNKNVNILFGNKLTINTFSTLNLDYLKNRKIFYFITIGIFITGIISFSTLGLKTGIDFTGGRNFVIRFDKEVKTNDIREALSREFESTPEVKTFGNNDQVRITTNYLINDNSSQADSIVQTKLFHALKGFYTKADISYLDFCENQDPRGIQSTQKVQPTIAREILGNAIWAVLVSLILIFIYIAVRFKNWQFGLGGVLSLVHDTFLTITLFSLLYKIVPFNMEVDQSFIAALLTIIGYSINNVVIIFDRVRENLNEHSKRSLDVNFNSALNSTMGRTINTAGTTIIVLLSIFIFGGAVIRGFVFAMLVGILAGTYSAIFVSSPIAYDLLSKKFKKLKK